MSADAKLIVVSNQFKKALAAASSDQLEKMVKAGGLVVENAAKINCERVFSSESLGNLAASIQTVVSEKKEKKVMVDIGPTVVYGRIQELGGVIRPIKAKMLHWIDQFEGRDAFAKVVHIPARPYLRPALDENQSDIKDAVEYQLRKNLGGVL